ncbi:High-affinity zinc uptake system binding-protein ZnuA precursor [Staphylococcus arlettae]|nr:High-affinity zinc uptake system binding-protein ZnuA precursor [Staphylococcus arlettae]RBA03486.1 High-affinity zinc uptake system binding-protein ZnuA precursor [Staphylococcus arlettae]RBA06849.1 High-affinity zinc uptake system binding-protein ZnuA precursor [Staphylococcus arlettae]
MKKITYMLIMIGALMIVLAACSSASSTDKKSEELTINTTVFPLKSFTEQIGGKHVEVKSIYPTGTDLHSYEPTQKDLMEATKADLFIYTGDDLDPVAKKVAKTIKDNDKKLSLQKDLKKSELLTDQHEHEAHESHDDHHKHEHEEHQHGTYDPHVWLDPKLNEQFIKSIKEQLIEKDPSHKETYEKNYKKLQADLEQLDQQLTKLTKDKQGKTLYISHESMGYLAERYGFEQKGVQNMSAEDPSQKDLTNMVKAINKANVKYILYEDNVSTKVTDTIRKETDAKPVKFYNMESLNKQQEQDNKVTYQQLMNKNIKNIEKALSY